MNNIISVLIFLQRLKEKFPQSKFDIDQEYFNCKQLQNVEYIQLRTYSIEGWTVAVKNNKVL